MNRSLDSWEEARGVDLSEVEIIDLAATVKELLRESTEMEI